MKGWLVSFIAVGPFVAMLFYQFDADDWQGWAFLAAAGWWAEISDRRARAMEGRDG